MNEEIKNNTFYIEKNFVNLEVIEYKKILEILDKYNNQPDYKVLYFNIIRNVVKDFYGITKDIKKEWLGYVDLDCPNCSRHRVEIINNKLICEKCYFELIDLQELEQKHNIGSDGDE